MLDRYRVLDLTDRRGWLAGFLLAQLGAEVVLVEPPGGWERDDWFAGYNRGKRSVVAGSEDELAALALTADVVIDCGAHAVCPDLAALAAHDPTLITVALSPFGGDGPKADWLATDLTICASAGGMAVTGDSDRPPVRISIPQAWSHASAEAAVGALIALHERRSSGIGQHVDVSAQQATAATGLPAIYFAPSGLPPVHREAGGLQFGPIRLRFVYSALDGYVSVAFSFGPMIGPFTRRLVDWMYEEGACDAATRDTDWVELAVELQTGARSYDIVEKAMDLVAEFFATKTKDELLQASLDRQLLIAPISTIGDVLASTQLAARGYWEEVDGIRHPGPIIKASRTPLEPLGPAPACGEHQDALGPAPRRPLPAPRTTTAPPLAGLKVADLSWVAAAPLATRVLAHWGATVVRVESEHRPCLCRGALGHRDDIPEQENAITWQAANAGKMGVTLNLARPEARDVVRDLVRWADVVVESFTPGTMDSWGLGYEELRRINPSVVMLSSCVMGQTGPLRDFAGFGNLAASVAGFFDVTGWPDRPPAGPYMAYTDYTSPRFTLCGLLAALDHRDRTGEGQYLDFSQMEAATHFLTPGLVALQRTGAEPTRMGNDDPEMAPHGVYPTHGDDEWVAVACQTDDQWRNLTAEMRRADLADLTTGERLTRRRELDDVVAAWTARQDGHGVAIRLQQHGVPAHLVQNSGDCMTDPQLVHRGHFAWLPHPYVGRALVDQPPYQLSRSGGGAAWAGPTYGQHTFEVLSDILGYDADRIADLAAAGVLE
jgi:crotonobetainyl-CoA:carnitine CoA-transferase CaiB-like acyl-CoA transferase